MVYTRDWVVAMMLDLVGYTPDQDLGAETIVEPGCGDGSFLRQIVSRLVTSARAHNRHARTLSSAVRAYELDADVVRLARVDTVQTLTSLGVAHDDAVILSESWIIEGDFLLRSIGPSVKWVIGNPPYVRIEESSRDTYAEYRRRWTSMSGRADVYIGFYQAGLSILKPGGKLCFICADRWMHNQYGRDLRRLVVEEYWLEGLIEMHDVDVFDVAVSAYPAVTLIARSRGANTALVTARRGFGASAATELTDWWRADDRPDFISHQFSASVMTGQFRADQSWPSGPPERLRLLTELESALPTLAEVGVVVRVGMATGADGIFIVGAVPAVEAQFLHRAVGPADLTNGQIEWRERYFVSPWDGHDLADLARYPGLRAYMEAHEELLRDRYVGRRNSSEWWRTIDRPPKDLHASPKLIVADINDRIEPVLDSGGYWPLHSAYVITSREWDLESLGGYLLSDVAGAFVEAYSVKMANGHLRISGQYLKKVRIPRFAAVEESEREALRAAFRDRDRSAASLVARRLIARLSSVPLVGASI